MTQYRREIIRLKPEFAIISNVQASPQSLQSSMNHRQNLCDLIAVMRRVWFHLEQPIREQYEYDRKSVHETKKNLAPLSFIHLIKFISQFPCIIFGKT